MNAAVRFLDADGNRLAPWAVRAGMLVTATEYAHDERMLTVTVSPNAHHMLSEAAALLENSRCDLRDPDLRRSHGQRRRRLLDRIRAVVTNGVTNGPAEAPPSAKS